MFELFYLFLAVVICAALATVAWCEYRKQLAEIAQWDPQLAEATAAKLRGRPVPEAQGKGRTPVPAPFAA
jgi:hypothetical protein